MELSDSVRMKAADRQAIEQLHIPSLHLMETAAAAVAAAAAERLPQGGRCDVFCGPGNNGGDGIAAARLLQADRPDARIQVWLVGLREKMTSDSIAMEQLLEHCGLALTDYHADDPACAIAAGADVYIDAIFGIGLRRPLEDDALAAVQIMKDSGAAVVAADVPSGVDADTGLVLGAAAPASVTVTFSRAKPGHYVEPGCEYTGQLRIIDIGIPKYVLDASGCGVYLVDSSMISLPRRKPVTHKGDYGKILVLAGSLPYSGAASLCAQAAMRSGAGLVYLGVPADIYELTAAKNTEVMTFPLHPNSRGQVSEKAWGAVSERIAATDICVIGPGLGRSPDVRKLVWQVLRKSDIPVVADADALWAIACNPDILEEVDCPLIITPHEGEFARLLGHPVEDRLSDSIWFARQHHCVVVLKGHRTICAFPDGKAYIIHAGNPGMATGGSGDVLAGTIGALLGQLPSRRAVVTACWLHARAGDIAASRLGEYGMIAGDIITALPLAEKEILQG